MAATRTATTALTGPDGLAVPPGNVVRSRSDMANVTDTQARLHRTKQRLYVICQLGSWTTFFAIQVMYVAVFVPKTTFTFVEMICAVGRICAIGLLITHFARRYITQWGWKEMGWRALWPRVVGTGFALGYFWCLFSFFLDLVVLQYPWKRDYGIWQGIVVVGIQSSVTMIGWLCVYFFYHVLERLQRLQVEQLRMAASVKEAELRALKSQVNPHFLFNSLNSLRALIDEDAPRARESVTRLANMLRYSLQSGQQETVPLDDEVRIVQDYLALEQIRHEDRLRVTWRLENEAELRLLPVPPMLLQTLVENAVKYGISPRREGGEIVIAASLAGAALHISVSNPGDLAAPASAAAARAGSSTGVGLRNASDRLKLLFGDRASLTLLAEPAGCVTADVYIPLNPPAR